MKDLEQNLNPTTEWNWFKDFLRRRRHRRMARSNPPPSQGLALFVKSLQSRWRKWKLRQQNRQQLSSPDLTTWLRPSPKESLSTRDALVVLLRWGASALLVLIAGSLVLNALPLRLGGPEWYLQVLAFIAENVPVIILSAIFSLLSLQLGNNDLPSIAYRRKVTAFSRLLYWLAVLLIPTSLVFTGWLYGQAFSGNRTQLSAIRANSEALIKGAQQTSTNQEFVTYLRSRNMTGNLESIAAAPLYQVKTEFVRTIQMGQKQQEQRLAADFRSTLLRYTTNAVKLLFTLVVFAAFVRLFHGLLKQTSLPRETAAIVSPHSGPDPTAVD